MTERKVRADMDLLADKGVLCKYHVNGFNLIHVTSWREHQKISHPTPSKLPPCPQHEADLWDIFANSTDPSTERFRDLSRGIPENLRSDSATVQCSSVEVSQVQYANRPYLVAEPVRRSQTFGLGGTA